jgi:hypothetical protein
MGKQLKQYKALGSRTLAVYDLGASRYASFWNCFSAICDPYEWA